MSANPLVELVFHAPGGGPSSAFAHALETVLAGSGELRLVSPYLGASVLDPLLRNREDYRLITDLKACFDTGIDATVAAILGARPHLLRHLDGVHAKSAFNDDAGYFGSANLTRSGFAQRDELGCVVREPQLLQTLSSWFEDLWNSGHAVSGNLLDTVLEQARIRAQAQRSESLPEVHCLPARRPTARTLGWMQSTIPERAPAALDPNDGPDPEDVATLLVELGVTADQSHTVLALLDEALEVAGLGVDDQRLHLRASSKRGSKYSLHVTICQRYVAWLERKRKVLSFGFILDEEDLAERVRAQFGDRVSLGHFKRPSAPAMHVRLGDVADVLPHIRDSWHRAIRAEVERPTKTGNTRRTSYSKHRQPGLYPILRSPAAREAIVDLVRQGGP